MLNERFIIIEVVALRFLFTLTFVVAVLTACSRESDISSPKPFNLDDLPDCSDAINPRDLIRSISILNSHRKRSDRVIDAFVPTQGVTAVRDIPFLARNISLLAEFIDVGEAVPLPDDGYFREFIVSSVSGVITINDSAFNIEDGVETVFTELQEGVNSFELALSAEVVVAEGRLDCFFDEEINEDSIPVDKTLSVSQNYSMDLVRASSISDITLVPSVPSDFQSSLSVDGFGSSIATWDKFLFFGAPLEDSLLADSGAVYVYEKSVDGLLLNTILKASNADVGDQFGFALSADNGRLMVSARYEDGDSNGVSNVPAVLVAGADDSSTDFNSGAVYEFKLEGDRWVESTYIKSPLNVLGANGYEHGFGFDVALSGNYLIVGSPLDSTQTSASTGLFVETGKAYLFELRSDNEWVVSSTLSSSYLVDGEEFGASVDIQENLVAVGAPGDDSAFRGVLSGFDDISMIDPVEPEFALTRADSGAVYLFDIDSEAGLNVAYFKASNADEEDLFGSAVSVANEKLLVGAPLEDGRGVGLNRDLETNDLQDSGAAYQFELNIEGRWIQRNYIKSELSASGNQFATDVAVDNEFFAINEPRRASDAGDSLGFVGVYDSDFERIFSKEISDADDMTAQELFGQSILFGNGTLLVGAPGYESLDTNTGLTVNTGAAIIYE